MPNNKPVYYWDACIFIAWLQDESRPPGEMEGLAEVVDQISRNQATMITSVLTRTELLDSRLSNDARTILDGVFKRSNIYQVEVTARIAEIAHEIRDHYIRAGERKIKVPDATHLATAIAHRVDQFHTFDDPLLNLSENVAGYGMKIVKPRAVQGSLMLGPF